MALGILVLLSALSISAVAIYYSIAGLVAIFAAAAIPIMIMGTALEVGKLVTAVWLHKYWSQAKWWLRTYLAIAVAVLMFITSMGIFGYLSKAHIEQTSASIESVEKISQLDTEIGRYKGIITRAEEKIESAENQGANKNDTIQDQIDREQKRIDTAYDRIKPLVQEQQKIIQQETERKDKKIEPYLAQVNQIDADLNTLSSLLNRRDSESVKRLQSIVGTRVDGNYGSRTAKQVEDYRNGLIAQRDSVLQIIATIEEKESPIVKAANEEIKRLRDIAEQEIADSNKVINKLRDDIGSIAPDNNTEIIEENLLKIKEANKEIDTLTEQKYTIEAEYRKLEAEVGPIKYIAEFIYGEEADRDMLEEAVRWVIILIIFVFDPLAVLLLIASQYTFDFARSNDGRSAWRKYEQARAQKIVENSLEDEEQEDVNKRDLAEGNGDNEPQEQPAKEEKEEQKAVTEPVKKDEEPVTLQEALEAEEPKEVSIEKKDTESSVESKSDLDNWNEWVEAANAEAEAEAKAEGMLFGEDNLKKQEIKDRANLVKQYETDAEWTKAKRRWKDDNPEGNIKDWKQAFISGRIHELPWASYVGKDQRIKPDLTEVVEPENYQQNAEQSENSVWSKIRKDDK